MDATLERRWNKYTPYFLVFKVGVGVSGTNDSMESTTPSFLSPERRLANMVTKH